MIVSIDGVIYFFIFIFFAKIYYISSQQSFDLIKFKKLTIFYSIWVNSLVSFNKKTLLEHNITNCYIYKISWFVSHLYHLSLTPWKQKLITVLNRLCTLFWSVKTTNYRWIHFCLFAFTYFTFYFWNIFILWLYLHVKNNICTF